MATTKWTRTLAEACKASSRSYQMSYFSSMSNQKVIPHSVFKISPLKDWKINNLQHRCLTASACLLGPENDNPDEIGEELEKNPFYEKYADKINKAKTEGPSKPISMEQISHRMKHETKKIKNQMKNIEQRVEMNEEDSSSTHKSTFPKKLDDIMKMESLADKSGKEIGEIWTDFYRSKPVISAVIPGYVYDRIYSRSVECPSFIYPLAKDQGYQFVLGQFSGNQCFFTSLLDYQVHGENAPWQMNLTHFTELQQEKDVVLMAGEIDHSNLNSLEAQCLAQQLQIFYATSDEERFNLVHVFNKQPDKFKYMDVIKEVEASRLIENLNIKK